jgi:subtilisin family serine protease
MMEYGMRSIALAPVIVVVLLISLIGMLPGTLQAQPHQQREFIHNDLIVRLHPRVDPQAFAASVGLSNRPSDIAALPDRPVYRFRIEDQTAPSRKAASLANHPSVVYAEPNYVSQIPEARRRSSWAVGFSAAEYAAQWAPQMIRLPAAHAINRGAGVTVAILDTGIDVTHPALQGQLLPGYDFVDNDADPSEVWSDAHESAYGHGTHVAGLVLLAAPEALILPLRTLDSTGGGTIWAQVLALRAAADANADVINLSFSFDQRSRLLDETIAELTCTVTGNAKCRARGRSGAVVVVAAGNSGTNVREWPGASTIPGSVAVTASTERDTLASFATVGPWVTLAAPGEQIISTVPGGEYAVWSGTSMSAPLTSGVAALLRSHHPHLRPADVAKYLVGGAAPISETVRYRLDALGALTHSPE